MRTTALLASILLTACTTGVPLKHVELGHEFHDGNSKVFIVDKFYIHELNIAPVDIYQKEVMIFHSSGKVNYAPLKRLGEVSPHRGTFTIESQNNKLNLFFEKGVEWSFSIDLLSSDSILLRRENTPRDSVSILLKPIPFL